MSPKYNSPVYGRLELMLWKQKKFDQTMYMIFVGVRLCKHFMPHGAISDDQNLGTSPDVRDWMAAKPGLVAGDPLQNWTKILTHTLAEQHQEAPTDSLRTTLLDYG